MKHPTSYSHEAFAILIDAGFSVFPLIPRSKKPAGSWTRWQDEQANADEIASWLTKQPDSNFGVATGSISGIVVLDLDSEEASAEAERRGLPCTVEATTPRGRHLYFAHPGSHVPNVVGSDGADAKLPLGLDVRGDGGYVVASGSYYVPTPEERAVGKIEGAYQWRDGRSPAGVAFAAMPEWLVKALAAPPAVVESLAAIPATPSGKPTLAALRAALAPTASAWGLAALQAESDNVRAAIEGHRNDQLNRSAFAIAQIVGGGGLDEQTARAELLMAAQLCGLTSTEAKATLRSGWRAGLREPRSVPVEPQLDATPSPTLKFDALGTIRSAAELARMETPPRRWLWQDWLPVGACTVLNGDGGLGKSLLAKQIATAVASGTPLFGIETAQAKILALYCEDDDAELARRQKAVCGGMNIPWINIKGYFYQSRFGQQSLLGHIDKRTGAFETNELFASIRARALDNGIRLIILDNVNMLFGDNINDPGAVTRFMAALNGLALDIDGAVLLLGHIAKNEGSQFAGTAAWSNASRNRLFLSRPDGGETRVLTRAKANYASTGEEIAFTWHKGAFMLPSEVGSGGLSVKDVDDNDLFLALLDQATAQRKPLSINRRAGNYAPAIMAAERTAWGSHKHWDRKRRMEAAMTRLLESGAITERGLLPFKTEHRKQAFGIARIIAPQSAAGCASVIVGDDENTPESTGNCEEWLAPESCVSVCASVDKIEPRPERTEAQSAEKLDKSCASVAPRSAARFPQTPIGSVSPPLGGGANIPSNPLLGSEEREQRLDDIMARIAGRTARS